MPYDTGEPSVKFAKIPLTDGTSEPLFNKALIFLQTRGAWGLARLVPWVYSSKTNGSMIRTTDISAFIGNYVKIYLRRRGEHPAYPRLVTLIICSFGWHSGCTTLFTKNDAIGPLLYLRQYTEDRTTLDLKCWFYHKIYHTYVLPKQRGQSHSCPSIFIIALIFQLICAKMKL